MLKKTGVIVAATVAMVVAAAPFALADSGQSDQHNDQECNKSIINDIKLPLLGSAESEHENHGNCSQHNAKEDIDRHHYRHRHSDDD